MAFTLGFGTSCIRGCYDLSHGKLKEDDIMSFWEEFAANLLDGLFIVLFLAIILVVLIVLMVKVPIVLVGIGLFVGLVLLYTYGSRRRRNL
jgi:cytochrome b561